MEKWTLEYLTLPSENDPQDWINEEIDPLSDQPMWGEAWGSVVIATRMALRPMFFRPSRTRLFRSR